jgi:peptidoglycan/xylan/chitin deacetylase (PgdA/CDA1 family)
MSAQLLKKGAKKMLLSAAGRQLLNWYRGRGSILMYHRISPTYFDTFEPQKPLRVTPQAFDQQLRYLSEHFTILPLDQFLQQSLRTATKRRHAVSITFDDGYADNMQWALPILERYDAPATIFLCNSFISGQSCPWWDELAWIVARVDTLPLPTTIDQIAQPCGTADQKEDLFLALNAIIKQLSPEELQSYMHSIRSLVKEDFPFTQSAGQRSGDFLSWADVQELSSHPLVSFGSHTQHHYALSTCSTEQVRSEIVESAQEISEYIKSVVPFLAYPFGSEDEVGPREFTIAQQCAASAAFTTRFGHIQTKHNQHCWSLPRLAIDGGDTLSSFSRKLSGYDACVAQRGRRLIL